MKACEHTKEIRTQSDVAAFIADGRCVKCAAGEARYLMCPFPSCGRPLVHVVEGAPGVLGRTADGPELQHDAKGHFMKCPHCSQRVAFEQVMQPTGLPGFRVARVQSESDE